MANKERGEVTLALGGESYVLVPSFGAVCEIEDALGTSLFNLARRLVATEIAAREVIDLAHACVTHACPSRVGAKLGKAALGEAILDTGTLEVMTVLAEFCFNYATGGRREKKVLGAGTGSAETGSATEESAPTPNPASSSAPA